MTVPQGRSEPPDDMAGMWPPPELDWHRVAVHVLMVVGPGEGDRWLDAMLAHHEGQFDTFTVYADGVDDTTAAVLAAYPEVRVIDRPSSVPGFMEHEGRFRQAAWDTWQARVEPEAGDWVLVPDADEFTVPHQALVGLGGAVRASARFAEQFGYRQVGVPIREAFGLAPAGDPLIRVDGGWDGNAGPRLVRWAPGGWFRDRAMGCGSVPATDDTLADSTLGLPFFQIVHYGYVDPDDVAAKYRRYTEELSDHGHGNEHIESIVKPPRLVPLLLDPPIRAWRGPGGGGGRQPSR